MNYWIITTEFPPIHGGGISTYCWHTAKMLTEKGHYVTIFINDYSVSSIVREKPLSNTELIRFNPNLISKSECLGADARLSYGFADVLEKEMQTKGVPEVLETQDYKGIAYYTLQKKLLLYPNFKNLKVVMTMHAPSFLYFEYNQVPLYNFPDYWTGEMEKATIRMADVVISPSTYLIEELHPRMELVQKNPIRVFNPFLNEWTTNEIPTYTEGDLVFFGKLTPQKGALEMLTYLKKMWDNGFDKAISIIGGGQHFFYPMQEDMMDYIKKKYALYISKGFIQFEGNLPPSKLKERLLKAHVVITPSIVDNLPYAVLEAMAIGKIVLSSTNGGHTEILTHNESGFIFSHKEKDSFEKVLTSILAKNSEELTTIGKRAQKAVHENTNYDRVYTEKKTIIDSLVSNYTPPSRFPFIESREQKTVTPTNKEKGLLSVIIPYYNMGDFVEETIVSVTKSIYTNIEIILINDGSDQEASIQKLKEVEKKYPITVYTKENEGLSATRNFGANKAKGQFLAFLDSDDTVSPEYYKNALEVLKQYENVSFIGSWAQYFGESTATWPTFNPEPPYLLIHNMINSSALVYKTDAFLAFGENDPSLIYGMEDYDSVISMVKNGARGLAFPELWWQYRIRSNSMAQSFTKDKELYLYRLISEKHHEFYSDYGSKVSNLLNHNGPGINYDNPTFATSKPEIVKQKILSSKLANWVKKNRILRGIAKKMYRFIFK